jgi:hypothetical protein
VPGKGQFFHEGFSITVVLKKDCFERRPSNPHTNFELKNGAIG